jgi:cytochrome c-type biogenesis protein CcmH/NrfF
VDWKALPRHGYRDVRAPEVTGALVTLWIAAFATLGAGAWALARAVRREP